MKFIRFVTHCIIPKLCSPPRFFYFPLFPCSLPLPQICFFFASIKSSLLYSIVTSITSDCCRLDDYVSLHYLLKHMAHLVQAAVWTAGLDDRLTDSGLISFQLCKAYAPPVGVKGQISTVCLYTAGGNLASKDNFNPLPERWWHRFPVHHDKPWKGIPGRIEDEGRDKVPAASPIPSARLFQYNRGHERKSVYKGPDCNKARYSKQIFTVRYVPAEQAPCSRPVTDTIPDSVLKTLVQVSQKRLSYCTPEPSESGVTDSPMDAQKTGWAAPRYRWCGWLL